MRDFAKYFGICATMAVLSPMALAQDAGSGDKDAVLDTIVVTAQFKEQNVQDTPIAITAMTGEMLEARSQTSIDEIAAQAPNVSLTTGGGYAGPALVAYIRGIGQTDFNPALEPGVGVYVDDVYYSTLTGSVLDLLDLDRVEVLRGPQGTLAGKNSIGGSIKLYTQRPDSDANGYIEVGAGSFNELSVKGASNFTIVKDKLFARVSGTSRSRDGYVDTLDYDCVTGTNTFGSQLFGSDCKIAESGGISYTSGRLALRYTPSDNLDINLSGDWVNDNSQAAPVSLLNVGPTIAPAIVNGSIWETVAIPPTLGSNVGCMFITYGPNSCNPASPNDPYTNFSTYADPRTGLQIPRQQVLDSAGYSLNVDWDINDNMQLQSISAYREYDASWAVDGDGSPFPVQMLYQTLRHDALSQEFRLNGQHGIADWTVGAFYHDANTEMEARVTLGYVGFDFIHGPDPVDSTTWALFANSSFAFTEKLELNAGIRYSDDEKTYTFVRTNPDLSAIQPCLGPPGTPGNPPNCLISDLNGASDTFSDDRIDYRAALSYKFTPDMMGYVQYATGYKGGGVNPRPFYNAQVVTFNPEELSTIEAGFKAELLNNTMRVNGAVFFNDYTEIQLQLNGCVGLFPAGFDTPCLAQFNAGDAEMKGAELEFDYSPVAGLVFDGSLALLDFEYKNLNPRLATLGATGIPQVPENGITPHTPETSWSLGAQYTFETSMGTIRPRVDISHRGDVFTEPHNSTNGQVDAYTMVNGSITWKSMDDDWSLTLEGKNLTDELYYGYVVDATPGLGGHAYGTPALPRTFKVTAKRRF